MKSPKILGAIAVGAAATLALAACSSNTDDPTSSAQPGGGEPVDLSFLTFETPALTADFWDQSIENALETVPGVTITKIVSPDADRNGYAKQLQSTGQFPDVLASINPKDFTEAGLLEPFDQAWLDDNFVLPNGNAIDSKTYIPPTNSQILPLVFYNKTIFEQNGLVPPTTWSEFLDTVAALKKAGVVPIELAGLEGWSASMPVVALASADVLGSDPNWIQERYDGTVHFTDPVFVSAMEKHRQLVEMGAYDPNALGIDFPTANQNFLDGHSGMYIMGSWFTGSSYMTAEQADTFGAFPLPTDDGTLVVPFNVGGTTSVSSQSANVAKAVDFAKAWSLAPGNLSVLIETDGAYPMMKKLALDDFGVSVSSLYTDTYSLVTSDNTKVSAFGWVNNDDALAPGINDLFYALSQQLFTDDDVKGQLAQLDSDWDAATS